MTTTILLVEDNKDLRDNAVLVLQLEGYEVASAGDGREALDILENGFEPQLIVSDIMMPRMDGYEFFEAVRQHRHLRTVPFIFLTARSSKRDVSVGRLLGVDDYLVKPFDPEELLIAIQTRLKRTDEIRTEARESLQDARRQLVDVLSHELRTPLTYVTGGFALLAEDLKDQFGFPSTENVQASLELIQSGTERLNRLAEQMVLYSQLISGNVKERLQTTGEKLDLAFLIYDARDLMSVMARERGMIFRQNLLETETLAVFGVRDLLVAAFSEVIRNALLYSPPGTQIKLSMARERHYGVYTVRDEGRGIKPEDLVNIWNVMIQSDRDYNEQQGTGMGLPIVKGLIAEHGGQIELDSIPGQGTCVKIWLPLVLD